MKRGAGCRQQGDRGDGRLDLAAVGEQELGRPLQRGGAAADPHDEPGELGPSGARPTDGAEETGEHGGDQGSERQQAGDDEDRPLDR